MRASRGRARNSWPARSTTEAAGATAPSRPSTARPSWTTLLEAELLGIEERKATGGRERRGKFENADGGTSSLDEVADLCRPPPRQTCLQCVCMLLTNGEALILKLQADAAGKHEKVLSANPISTGGCSCQSPTQETNG